MSVADRPFFEAGASDRLPPRRDDSSSSANQPTEPRERLQVLALIAAGGLCYLLAAWFRYHAFRAGAYDLGIFDQAVYLISQGKVPYSTLIGNHIIADHAAVVFYAIAQLYRIYPTIFWLLLIQASCLAAPAWPLWRLARNAGVGKQMSLALIGAYLLYPVIAMASLRDFYPEQLMLPSALAMMLCARQKRFGWFIFWLLLALSTKEAMAITFGATGVYLALVERRFAYGIICTVISVAWFVIATHFIIPHFGHGLQPDSTRFYSYMGHTQGQILHTMLLRPWVPMKMLFQKHSVMYLAVLAVPVLWGLSPRNLGPLLCAAPCILLNLISNKYEFYDPFHHYSYAAVPFIFLAVVESLAHGHAWFVRARWVVIWALALVVAGGALRGRSANSKQITAGAGNDEKRAVIAMIDDGGGVLTTHQVVPHLSHREVVEFVQDPNGGFGYFMPPDDQIDWVLLDFNEDSVRSVLPFADAARYKYQKDPAFKLVYQNGALYLFHRISQRGHDGTSQN
jgi:uncharacterized membrane protein